MALQLRWYIYALTEDRHVRYVGWTRTTPHARFSQHIKESLTGSSAKCQWLRPLVHEDRLPEVKVLQIGIGDGWADAERAWIQHFREVGCDLSNSTAGGEGYTGTDNGFTSEERGQIIEAEIDDEQHNQLGLLDTIDRSIDQKQARIAKVKRFARTQPNYLPLVDEIQTEIKSLFAIRHARFFQSRRATISRIARHKLAVLAASLPVGWPPKDESHRK